MSEPTQFFYNLATGSVEEGAQSPGKDLMARMPRAPRRRGRSRTLRPATRSGTRRTQPGTSDSVLSAAIRPSCTPHSKVCSGPG